MKAAQKKPIKIDLSRSLCKLVSGAAIGKGGGVKDSQVEKADQGSDG